MGCELGRRRLLWLVGRVGHGNSRMVAQTGSNLDRAHVAVHHLEAADRRQAAREEASGVVGDAR